MSVEGVARRWGIAPEALKAFRAMVVSGPWEVIQSVLTEVDRGAQEALLTSTELEKVFRAQGQAGAVKTIRDRVKALMEDDDDR